MSQFQAQKVPVLIASTLKPIRDVRAYEKLALSLGETNKYSLFIIGFSPKKPKSKPGFRFFSSMSHFDSRMDRLFAQGRFLFRLLQIRPKILICCTFELLPIASFLKPLLSFKMVYDVQENYRANLDLNPELPEGKKRKLGDLIHTCETIRGIDLFLLAERCYAVEMPEKKPFLILENKFQGNIRQRQPIGMKEKKDFQFCITGTITPAFGVWDAVRWFEKIRISYPESKLEIVGHCPIGSFRQKLEKAVLEIPNISLTLDQNPVPHMKLIDCIMRADFVLMPYQQLLAIKDKMPTKLYECAALGIPVLISSNPIWERFLADFGGGYSIDFSDWNAAVPQFDQAIEQTFFSSTPPESVLWKTEKAEFQLAIQNLLS